MTDRTLPPPPDLDWEYRPASYWDHPDPVSAVVSGIKGQERRNAIRRSMTGDEGAWALTEDAYQDSLSSEQRKAASRIHPSLMGGEYLPEYLPGEVEIARVVLASVMQDVISVRARRSGGRILYRVVDEYPEDGSYRWKPRSSAKPLTLGGVIRLIDSASKDGLEGYGKSLPDRFRNYNLEGSEAEELRHFVAVESDLYPQLATYYAWQAEQWFVSVSPEEEEEESEEDEAA